MFYFDILSWPNFCIRKMVLAAAWRVKSGEWEVSGTRTLQLIQTWNDEVVGSGTVLNILWRWK